MIYKLPYPILIKIIFKEKLITKWNELIKIHENTKIFDMNMRQAMELIINWDCWGIFRSRIS